jgi:hypothetical protein
MMFTGQRYRLTAQARRPLCAKNAQCGRRRAWIWTEFMGARARRRAEVD